MKTKIISLGLLSIWSITSLFAQDRTTVTATNSDISDNLDLRAVASIFGDSRNLEDFERRLNDPNAQISNLDLNGDNQVDYLRVIETVEGNAHIVVIQSVLGRDTYQDIATIEVERDRYNKVQVQVVGDVYMYGNNYIYEPVYAYTPVIYNTFWVSNYRPYCSSWYWGYYPHFYVAWNPIPFYTYHNHIGIYINIHNHYNYVNYRRCAVAYNYYYAGRRGNAYERQYPNRSFAQRNVGYNNRRELIDQRPQMVNTRNNAGFNDTRNNSSVAVTPRPSRAFNGSNEVKGSSNPRGNDSPRSVTINNGRENDNQSSSGNNGNTRDYQSSPRGYGNSNGTYNAPRGFGNPRAAESPGNYGVSAGNENPRSISSQSNSGGFQSPRTESPRMNQQNNMPRMNESSPRGFSQREFSQQRGGGSQRSEGGQRGGGNRRG